MTQWSRAALIALRIVVGWHFLYEGLWKIDSDKGTAIYSPARFTLQATTARLHDYFDRAAASGFELKPALAEIDGWHDSIVKSFAAYKQLDDAQKARLGMLRDQMKVAAVASSRSETDPEHGDPAAIANFDWAYVHSEVLKAAGEPESERFSSLGYLQNSTGPFRPLFRKLAPDIDGFERIAPAAIAGRIDARYREILQHFASAGKPFDPRQQTRLAEARDAIRRSAVAIASDSSFLTRSADYRSMAERVRRDESRLDAPYSRERLDADRKKLDTIAGELLAIANEPLSELAVQVHLIATADQLSAGPLPRPAEPTDFVDRAMKISLTVIGGSLLLGLWPKWGGLAAAGQLAMFYLASPPWPGMPAATMGGHYLYVDRNLIELVASLVIASTAHYTALRLPRRRGHRELSASPAQPRAEHATA